MEDNTAIFKFTSLFSGCLSRDRIAFFLEEYHLFWKVVVVVSLFYVHGKHLSHVGTVS